MPTNLEITTHLFLQIAVILAVARAAGFLLRKVGQTQVIAEMLTGVLLGPSLFGLVAPSAQQWLFPTSLTLRLGDGAVTLEHPSMTLLYVLGQLGLVLYMFSMGLHFNTALIRQHVREAGTISLSGIVVPVVIGGALGVMLARRPGLFGADLAPWQAALFLSAAMAITAFPVLARIIHDIGLTRTRLGTLVLGAAAIDDVTAWCLLALVLATASGTPLLAATAIGGGLLYVAVMLGGARRLFSRLSPAETERSGVPMGVLVATFVIVALCAAFTDFVGIHSVFGAFLAGMVMPRGAFADSLRRMIEPVTVGLLVPVFFVYSGLSTRVNLLFSPSLLEIAVLVILAGFLAKGFACTLASRLSGTDWRTAASIGALMNARGLMELVLINIGLDRGLITPEMFTILVLLTILTTTLAAPLFKALYRPEQEVVRSPARAELAQPG